MRGGTPRIAIAGGGIGGMAAALALLRRGFDVDVYEQAGELREVGAGIQISPNGNRALAALGVFETLRELSCSATGKEIRHATSGRTWTLFDLGDEAVVRYGFPYLTVYRPDLLRVLVDAVRREKPGALHLRSRCVEVRQSPDGVAVDLDGAGTVTADALIGADGIHSTTRRMLFGDEPPSFSGMVAWRALVPMSALPAHTARMVATNWIGAGGHVVHYPLHRGKMMNFVGTLEDGAWDGPPWTAPATREQCLRAFDGWHDDVLELVRRASSVQKWALLERPPLRRWTSGRIALLGDACHPTLPFLAQGAVFAIEDAVMLGRCLDESRDEVEGALLRYEKARIDRAYRMVRGAADNRSRFHAPELGDPAAAAAYVDREWSREGIAQRYEWLFTYDVTTADSGR